MLSQCIAVGPCWYLVSSLRVLPYIISWTSCVNLSLVIFSALCLSFFFFFFFQAEDGIRDHCVTGVQTCALPICLEAMVFGHGQVPHKESLARIKGIDVLLLLAENQPLQIPAKTYEYLLAEKPLIAFVDEGGATHLLLKRFDNVHCVSKQRKQELRGLIESISSGHISSVDREWSNQRNRNTGELSFAYHLKNLLRKMEQSNGQAS